MSDTLYKALIKSFMGSCFSPPRFQPAYHTPDFGGDLFDKFDLYWDRSPLKYARNVKTPTLILHSDNDFRVPLEQGEQWFRALKHFGVTTEIVMFPREKPQPYPHR